MTEDRHAGAVLTIDLDAIAQNWRALRDLSAPADCGAVIKANAYGLGAAPVGRALADAGCKRFFVACIEEGIELRGTLGPKPNIYVLDGLMGNDTVALFEAADLVPVLNSPGEIETWGRHARDSGGRRGIVALDTGMARLGLTPRELRDLADAPDRLDGIGVDFVLSHLACADDAAHPMNAQQRDAFDDLKRLLPAFPATLANSGGVFLGSGFHYDLTRPGAALFGVSASTGATTPLRQAIGLKAQILQLREIDSESTVGYGATRQVSKGARLATVAVGYADGYLRALSNRGHGYAGDIRIPIVGRVSMDLTTFDVSGVPGDTISAGDEIDLICAHHTVDDLAAEADTIGYVILTSLGQRYRRHYVGGGADA